MAQSRIFTDKVFSRSLSIMLAALCAAAPAAGHAQAIIIAASGPGAPQFQVGSIVKYGTMVKAGDKVTIMDGKGTRYIVGPKAITSMVDNTQTASVASQLSASGSHPRLGAVRALHGSPTVPVIDGQRPPSLWAVDVRYGGTRCYLPGTKPVLWRASPADTKDMKLTADGQPVSFKWPGSDDTAAFPGKDGALYHLETSGKTITFKVAMLPEVPTTPEAMKDALNKNGCLEQAGSLSESLGLQ